MLSRATVARPFGVLPTITVPLLPLEVIRPVVQTGLNKETEAQFVGPGFCLIALVAVTHWARQEQVVLVIGSPKASGMM